jgi:hypothetical protein
MLRLQRTLQRESVLAGYFHEALNPFFKVDWSNKQTNKQTTLPFPKGIS